VRKITQSSWHGPFITFKRSRQGDVTFNYRGVPQCRFFSAQDCSIASAQDLKYLSLMKFYPTEDETKCGQICNEIEHASFMAHQ
jgi:hypothetical protein